MRYLQSKQCMQCSLSTRPNYKSARKKRQKSKKTIQSHRAEKNQNKTKQNNMKKCNCTQVLQQRIYSDHIMLVNQWHTVQSTQSMLHGAGAYDLAADIWVIMWPEANGATAAWLEIRSNQDETLPEGVTGLASVMTKHITCSFKSRVLCVTAL